MKNYYSSLVSLSVVFLLVLSWIFALERIISADTATYLYNLVNNKTFNFGSQRFIASFTQVLPLILIYLKAPFSLVLKAYSLNMFLFHAGIIAILLFGFKDHKSALILLFSHLIAGSLLFYYPVSEYQMGLSWSVLLYSYLRKYQVLWRFEPKHFVFPLISLGFILYSHPLSIFFIGFMFFYLFLEKREVVKKILMLMVFVCGVIWLSKYLFFSVPNDTSNLDLIHGLKLFPENAWKIFWKHSISFDYVFLILVPLNLFGLVYYRKYKLGVFYFLFMLIHLHMCLSKLGSENFTWYSSHIYQALHFATSLIFIEQIWDKISSDKVKLILAVVVLGLTLNQTYHQHNFNTERVDYIEDLLEKTKVMNGNRGFLQPKNVPNNYAVWLWALDIESLILSTYKDEFPTSTVVIKSKEYVTKEEITNDNIFIVFWTSLEPDKEFNPDYFVLEPGTYQFIE